ncbi:MAG: DUF1698 domain-containing protein [Myxococcota bacterium]|nr:DUF1698 domain-containing protein [Myxococcota bacterium]
MSTKARKEEIDRINWFHQIDLGEGVVTPGVDRSQEKLRFVSLPERLDGMSVLDIGAWDGFFSFEAERRGASRVVAMDWTMWQGDSKRGFDLARDVLGSKVEDLHLDVMDLTPERVGTFDLVLFLGVFYHLEDPLAALRRAEAVCRQQIIVESLVDKVYSRRPSLAFYPGSVENGDASNWFGPNPVALVEMLREVGFVETRTVARRSLWHRCSRALGLRFSKPSKPFWTSIQQSRVAVHAWK